MGARRIRASNTARLKHVSPPPPQGPGWHVLLDKRILTTPARKCASSPHPISLGPLPIPLTAIRRSTFCTPARQHLTNPLLNPFPHAGACSSRARPSPSPSPPSGSGRTPATSEPSPCPSWRAAPPLISSPRRPPLSPTGPHNAHATPAQSLAATAVDRIPETREHTIAHLVDFHHSDMLCCRSDDAARAQRGLCSPSYPSDTHAPVRSRRSSRSFLSHNK